MVATLGYVTSLLLLLLFLWVWSLQAREAIVNDVTLLEFDMNGRVFPRLDAVRKAGIVGDVANGRTPQASLREMMRVLGRFSDARFVKWLARERVCPEAVEEHRGEAVPHKHL